MEITLADVDLFKRKALKWASASDICCCLDSNKADKYSKFDTLIAAGAKSELLPSAQPFAQLGHYRSANKGWLLGFLTYDLKNSIEALTSTNPDHLYFPELHFFEPEHLLIIKGNRLTIVSDIASSVLLEIENAKVDIDIVETSIKIQIRFNRDEYIASVKAIQQHILRGDIYVTNFCQEFYSDDAVINPLDVFIRLNNLSPNPFAAFYKLRDKYIICASPERFLAKRGNKLISQPIKGTAKRGNTPEEDEQIKLRLRNDEKELQENVMVVDLVRNDLTQAAKPGTVVTEELFGIYSFNQVHQMISTVVCDLADNISAVTAFKSTFPMGSMTGAPKISAMQLMEQYERSKRGVYSGAVGYFSPDGDFDFNVVIRSLLYNQTAQYLSFHTGSAITHNANAEQEYEECLLKASAIMQVLGNKS